jgi:hypothetical protein
MPDSAGYVMKVRGRLAALKHELDPHQGCEVRNRPRVKSFLILSRPHRLFARVLFRIAVEKFANQALVLRVVSARLGLEELEARATEEHRDPDLLLPGSRGSRQEVGEDAKCAKRFTGDLVMDAFASAPAAAPKTGVLPGRYVKRTARIPLKVRSIFLCAAEVAVRTRIR